SISLICSYCSSVIMMGVCSSKKSLVLGLLLLTKGFGFSLITITIIVKMTIIKLVIGSQKVLSRFSFFCVWLEDCSLRLWISLFFICCCLFSSHSILSLNSLND